MNKKPTIKILHALPNRIRVRLSSSIKNFNTFKKLIIGDFKGTLIRYNKLSDTLLISFDQNEILLQEMIYRICTAFSLENGMIPIKLLEEENEKNDNGLFFYSGEVIVLSALNKLFNPSNIELQDLLNKLSLLGTGISLLEHAYSETIRKGVFDLEVLPAFYLLKNYITKPSLSTIGLAWLTAFGRHIFKKYREVKEVKVLRIKNPKTNNYCYSLSIKDDKNASNISEALHHLIFNKKNISTKNDNKFIIVN